VKVVIAGPTGVLGRRTVKRLLERGHTVLGIVRSDESKAMVERLGAEGIVADLFNADELAKKVRRADVVIHAATAIPVKAKTKREDWALNDRLRTDGTKALTEAAHKLGAKTYIQQSIVWAARPEDDSYFDETTKIEKPGELYASALDGEKIAFDAGSKYGFGVSVLRCGGFYSADSGHTRMLGDALLKRRLPLIGSGAAIQANIRADDAGDAFVTAAEAGKQGLWHVTDDEPVELKEMLTEFARLLNAPPPRKFPLWLARIFLGKGVIDFFVRSTRTSNTRFKADFDWSPRYPSYRDGLKEIVDTWNLERAKRNERAI
jgi:nucleoside-diphosphate-sugar epimerase